MEVSITDINTTEKEIQIQAVANELAPHFEEAYKRYQTKAEIPGFRKGKAPLNLVKRIFGESIEYSSLDTVANDVYRHVMEERNIHPIGEPVLIDIDYKRGEKLSFKIKYEVKPSFELHQYTNIPFEKLIHRVTDKEVEGEILRLRRANHTLEDATSVSGSEFMVTADAQQLDKSGSPLIGKKTQDVHFYLADESLLPEIRDSLSNVTIGAVRKATIKREHEGHTDTDDLEITVKKIARVVLPEMNSEFVKKITKDKVATVDEFTGKLRSDLEEYWRERSDRRLTEAIVAEIVRQHDIPAPEAMVKGILDSLLEEVKNKYPDKKLPPDFKEDSFREANRSYGIFQSKWYLLRERILETEHIVVDDTDTDKLAEQDAPKVGIDKDRLAKFYRDSTAIKDRILSDKLMNFLKQHQLITEKVTEEFFE